MRYNKAEYFKGEEFSLASFYLFHRLSINILVDLLEIRIICLRSQ